MSSSLIEAYDRWEPQVHAWECYHVHPGDKGLSVGVKDVINTVDCATQMGSETWKGFTPGNDARVVTKLKEAGCAIVGKTVSAEFAVHHPGPTRNPHNLERTPGTSSSGSAVAVACGMADAALGTQTAGSIIRPASYCGVYAMKPSFGLIPRTGVLKTADTLDTVGFFARTPELLRTMLDICRVDGPDYPWTEGITEPRPVETIGTLASDVDPETMPTYAFKDLWAFADRLQAARLPRCSSSTLVYDFGKPRKYWRLIDAAHEIHRIIYHKSLAYYFKQEVETGGVSDIFRQQVEEGRTITLEQYQTALRQQEELAAAVDRLLSRFDILLMPSSAGPAPLFYEERDAPRDANLVWTLAGVPVINIPAFTSPDGLPFGISIIARRYHDYKLLDFLNTLQQQGLAPAGPNPLL